MLNKTLSALIVSLSFAAKAFGTEIPADLAKAVKDYDEALQYPFVSSLIGLHKRAFSFVKRNLWSYRNPTRGGLNCFIG